MKRNWWWMTLMLAVCSCEKPEVVKPLVADNVARKESTITDPPAPVREDGGESEENQRMRPHPRPPEPPKPPAPAYPTAVAVKGKEGYVMSPYNEKIIDVRDIPPGTLVADPTYPSEEKKLFRVP